jgi:hypothetical protein
MSTRTTTAPGTTDRTCAWLAEGFAPGAPGHVTAESVRTDRGLCRRMKCPDCGRRGLEYRPWHRSSRYRVLATCPGREASALSLTPADTRAKGRRGTAGVS